MGSASLEPMRACSGPRFDESGLQPAAHQSLINTDFNSV